MTHLIAALEAARAQAEAALEAFKADKNPTTARALNASIRRLDGLRAQYVHAMRPKQLRLI